MEHSELITDGTGPGKAEREQITQHLLRLRPANPTRAIATRWLAGDALTSEDTNALLDAIRRPAPRRWAEQKLACWLLGYCPLSPTQLTRASQCIKTLIMDCGTYSLLQGGLCAVVAGVGVVVLTRAAALLEPVLGSIWTVFAGLGAPLALIGSLVSGVTSFIRMHTVRSAAVVTLGRVGTPDTVVWLAGIAGFQASGSIAPPGFEREFEDNAWWALQVLLDRCMYDPEFFLPPLAVPILIRILAACINRHNDSRYAIRLINAFAYSDSFGALPILRAAIMCKRPDISAAAAKATALLEARSAALTQATSLLRPSSNDASHALLMASSANESDGNRLLRAVETEGSKYDVNVAQP